MCCNPPAILIRASKLAVVNCKVHLLDAASRYCASDECSNITPQHGSEINEDVPRLLLIPHKWPAELMDEHYLPAEFLDFVVDKLKDWTDVDQENNKFVMT